MSEGLSEKQLVDQAIQGDGPALQRLLLKGWTKAQWGASENNRRARYYTLTTTGRKQLTIERAEFDRLIFAIHKVLNTT